MADANVAVAFVEALARAAFVGVGNAFWTSENMRITIKIIIPIIPAARTEPPDCLALRAFFVYVFFSVSKKDIIKLLTPS